MAVGNYYSMHQVNGSYLEDVWLDRTSSEVHFRGKHLPIFPWGENAHWPLENEPYQNYWIDVAEFCHVTHKQQFYQIRKPNREYVLRPLKKRGKEGYYTKDGRLLGATYTTRDPAAIWKGSPVNEYTQYRRITQDEEVLPGYYIWWSVNRKYNRPFPDNDSDTQVSDLFSNPPTSVYGTKKISVMSYHLLQSYQEAFFNGRSFPRLEFRNGGTLRYKHEICYVVIVCAQGCFTGPLHHQYPLISAFNIKYNKQNGRISFVEKWRVKIRNGITFQDEECFSWDHYVFAFHYPFDDYRMILTGGDTKVEDVEHDFCVKKEFYNGKFVCPDKE